MLELGMRVQKKGEEKMGVLKKLNDDQRSGG